MSEKRRNKQRQIGEADKPSKEEYAVAKFLRFGLPPKQGKLVGMTVQCFVASKAVDALLESKWSSGKAKNDAAKSESLFTNRNSCINYCNRLLQKGLFHRAFKVERKKDREKPAKKSKKNRGESAESKDTAEEEKETKVRERRKGKKEKEKDREKKDDPDSEKGDKKKDEDDKEDDKEEKKDEEKKKKERRVKLVMHDDQQFVDGDEVYVWIYDPVPVKTFIIGLFLVLGAIGVCLFPLWPPEVRIGVYYVSLAGAGFVGFLLSLIIVRFILFCIVWGVTFGKHHFWFLPNLTEDVGFFESFQPLYKHELGGDKDSSKDSDSKKSVKAKKGQDSMEVIKEEVAEVVEPVESAPETKETEITEKVVDKEDSSEGSGSQEGFEMVDSEDAERDPDGAIEEEDDAEEQLTDEGDDNISDAEEEEGDESNLPSKKKQ